MEPTDLKIIALAVGFVLSTLASLVGTALILAWVHKQFEGVNDALTTLLAEVSVLRAGASSDDRLWKQNLDLHDRLLVINNPGYLRELRRPTVGEMAQAEVAVMAARRKDPTIALQGLKTTGSMALAPDSFDEEAAPPTEAEVEERRAGTFPAEYNHEVGTRRPQRIDPLRRVEAARAARVREDVPLAPPVVAPTTPPTERLP